MKKVTMITGSSRGLGATLARFLAAQGHDLILTSRTEGPLIEFAQTLEPFDITVLPMAGDVRDPGHRRRLLDQAASLGQLDILVNNASSLGQTPLQQMANISLAALKQVYETNVIAPVGLVQGALPLLRRSDGLVINISSDAALGAYPGWGGYGASKAALDLISETLANELRKEGVSVVSVDPGDMQTEMHQQAFPGEDISDRPLPSATIPFWGWLLGQHWASISGTRYQAQSERWEVPV